MVPVAGLHQLHQRFDTPTDLRRIVCHLVELGGDGLDGLGVGVDLGGLLDVNVVLLGCPTQCTGPKVRQVAPTPSAEVHS